MVKHEVSAQRAGDLHVEHQGFVAWLGPRGVGRARRGKLEQVLVGARCCGYDQVRLIPDANAGPSVTGASTRRASAAASSARATRLARAATRGRSTLPPAPTRAAARRSARASVRARARARARRQREQRENGQHQRPHDHQACWRIQERASLCCADQEKPQYLRPAPSGTASRSAGLVIPPDGHQDPATVTLVAVEKNVGERRKWPRVPWSARGKAFFGNEELSCSVVDVSVAGMGLVASRATPIGTFVRVQWEAPGNEWTDVDGILVHTFENTSAEWIWGIRVARISPQVAASIAALAGHVPAPTTKPPRAPLVARPSVASPSAPSHAAPVSRHPSAPAHSRPRSTPASKDALQRALSNRDMAALFREALEAQEPDNPKKNR